MFNIKYYGSVRNYNIRCWISYYKSIINYGIKHESELSGNKAVGERKREPRREKEAEFDHRNTRRRRDEKDESRVRWIWTRRIE
ncbi:unnamed protein product, partial [Vitis vinifera]